MAFLEWWIISLGIICSRIVAENNIINFNREEHCKTSSGEEGICVYQYQCNEGVISISGENIIDIRQPKDACNDHLMECCALNEISANENENPSTTIASNLNPEYDGANGVASSSTSAPSTPGTNVPAVDIEPYDVEGCGHRNKNGVIFTIENNQLSESEYGEFPWTVAIFARMENNSLRYMCGGALIDPTAVLTTATCLHPYRLNVSSLVVRLGEWDMSTIREPIPHVDNEMEKIVLHPQYKMTSKINDIAIIILRETIELNHTIGVVCLPPANEDTEGAEMIGVGWGNVPNFVEPKKLPQTILKKAHLRHLLHDQCQQTLRKLMGRRYILDRSFLCAEAQDTEMLPCYGDTGSPYVKEIANGNDRYYLVGLSSWGYDCNKQSAPTVLTNVAYHREWIDEVMKREHLNVWSYTYEHPTSTDDE